MLCEHVGQFRLVPAYSIFVLFCFSLPGHGQSQRFRVESKVWFDECMSMKRDIIIKFIIESISGCVMWFTSVGQRSGNHRVTIG
jgi:hypothetical protein